MGDHAYGFGGGLPLTQPIFAVDARFLSPLARPGQHSGKILAYLKSI